MSSRAIAKQLGWKLSKGFQPCKSCAEAKAKQKNVPHKTAGSKAEKPNERLFHDLATVKPPPSLNMSIGKPVWQLLVDEATGMKFSSFHATKADIVEPTCVKLNKLAKIAGNIEHLSRIMQEIT